MRRVTIRDVAAEAGVSIGTASKALNGQGKLRAETRKRVAETAQRLGFAPNTLAAELLLAAIAKEPAHGARTVPTRLVVRQSSPG